MPLTHRPFSRSTWYLLAVIIVSQFAMVAGGILYTNYATTQAARKSCASIIVIDDYFRKAPPSQSNDPRAKAARDWAAANHKLRKDLRCDHKR